MTPLRVAFLSPTLHLGGAERWIVSLCRHFDRARVRPVAVVTESPSIESDAMRLALPGDVPLLLGSHHAPDLSRIADVLIAWGGKTLDKIAATFGKRTVFVLHGANKTPWSEPVIASGLKSGAELVAVNEACLATLPMDRRAECTIIPNGVDEDRIAPVGPPIDKQSLVGDGPLILYAGRVQVDKDIGGMCEAVGELSAREPATLAIVGPVYQPKAPMAEWSEAAKGRVVFAPPVESLGGWFAAADVFLSLSPSEAHPLAITEAWLAGVPVVCSALPWLASVESEHGRLAQSVPFGSPPRLVADAIQRAMVDRETVARAQAVALAHFTAPAMARRWEGYLA